jgi:hypothetical protein
MALEYLNWNSLERSSHLGVNDVIQGVLDGATSECSLDASSETAKNRPASDTADG